VQQLLNVEKKIGRQKIVTRIEGHVQPKRSVIRIAQEINLNIRSIVHLRKRNKPLITLLSGPHVHKKSRDQYKIENRSIIFGFELEGEEGKGEGEGSPAAEPPSLRPLRPLKFLELKESLARLRREPATQAWRATYIYSKCEQVPLGLSPKGGDKNSMEDEQGKICIR
jgi:hypothetical protein